MFFYKNNLYKNFFYKNLYVLYNFYFLNNGGNLNLNSFLFNFFILNNTAKLNSNQFLSVFDSFLKSNFLDLKTNLIEIPEDFKQNFDDVFLKKNKFFFSKNTNNFNKNNLLNFISFYKFNDFFLKKMYPIGLNSNFDSKIKFVNFKILFYFFKPIFYKNFIKIIFHPSSNKLTSFYNHFNFYLNGGINLSIFSYKLKSNCGLDFKLLPKSFLIFKKFKNKFFLKNLKKDFLFLNKSFIKITDLNNLPYYYIFNNYNINSDQSFNDVFFKNFFFKNYFFFKKNNYNKSCLFNNSLFYNCFFDQSTDGNLSSNLTNHTPHTLINTFLVNKIFSKLNVNYVPNFYRYIYYSAANSIEFILKKKFFLKIFSKSSKDHFVMDFIDSLFLKNRSIQSRIGRGFFLHEMLDVIYTTFFYKDLNFLIK